MIFHCFPYELKCEWRHLSNFVTKFNDIHGKMYARSACLDVENRNGREPELLLESPGEIPIVIERKSIVWPSDYLSDHRNEHHLQECISDLLSDVFNDSLYQLTVHEEFLKGKKNREVREIAKQIACVVKDSQTEAKISIRY